MCVEVGEGRCVEEKKKREGMAETEVERGKLHRLKLRMMSYLKISSAFSLRGGVIEVKDFRYGRYPSWS
jgi:hypothetical protein